jgi:hypothetical protein
MSVWVQLSSYFLCSPGSWVGANKSLRQNHVGLSPTIGIFLYVVQAVVHVLAVAFRMKLLVRVPLLAYVYVALSVECVLPVVSGKKLCWFESPIGIFLYVSIGLKTFTKGTVELVSMMCVLGNQGGFVLALFQGWIGGVKYCWKICSSNFSFRNKFINFVWYGLLLDNTTL